MIYKSFNFLVLIFYNHISKFYCCKDTIKLSKLIIFSSKSHTIMKLLPFKYAS